MRESMGMTWTFQIMLIFILIFSAFLAVYINFSKAYKVKNEVINFIEKREGITDSISSNPGSIQLITNYLSAHAYGAMGTCPAEAGWYGARKMEGASSDIEAVEQGTKYYYCVKKVNGFDAKNYNRSYYEVRVFFKFDLPLVGNIYTFSIDGQTVEIDFPADNLAAVAES